MSVSPWETAREEEARKKATVMGEGGMESARALVLICARGGASFSTSGRCSLWSGAKGGGGGGGRRAQTAFPAVTFARTSPLLPYPSRLLLPATQPRFRLASSPRLGLCMHAGSPLTIRAAPFEIAIFFSLMSVRQDGAPAIFL